MLIISFIYSPCQSQWLDCIKEDEEYLRTNTSFYDECDIVDGTDEVDENWNNWNNWNKKKSGSVLKAASQNTCLGPRQCVNGQSSTDGLPHVGYDPFGTCTCSAKQNTLSNIYTTKNRWKRQVNEGFATVATNTRVQRAAKGGRQTVVDTTRQVRQKRYADAIKIATNTEDISEDFIG